MTKDHHHFCVVIKVEIRDRWKLFEIFLIFDIRSRDNDYARNTVNGNNPAPRMTRPKGAQNIMFIYIIYTLVYHKY